MLKDAIRWILNNAGHEWIPISHRDRHPYPEVTGYYIPTLLQVGQHDLAVRLARYLVSIQSADGSFTLDGSAEKFVFDTGQIIRGWVALAPKMVELHDPLRRACEWIVAGADPRSGKFQVPSSKMWSLGARGSVSEGIHIYVVQPIREAAAILDAPHILQAADAALKSYLETLDLTDFERPNALTHFYAYIQEALVETGHKDLAIEGMKSVARYQDANGAVPAYHDVKWICSTGVAQLAKVWHMIGEHDRAEAALNFFRTLQNYSGGFYGSYGPSSDYFPTAEISWAVKYAIDAELLSIQHVFNSTAHTYRPTISALDGRAASVVEACDGAERVLDVGCGNGRYAALIKKRWPNLVVHGVDISSEMLAFVPSGIETRLASCQDLPYEDGSFDVVYSVETLEHAPDPRSALTEMARVVAPGGRLVIVDKSIEKLGALQIERFEIWFDRDEIVGIFAELGFECEVSSLPYDGKPADGLFLCWSGKRKPG